MFPPACSLSVAGVAVVFGAFSPARSLPVAGVAVAAGAFSPARLLPAASVAVVVGAFLLLSRCPVRVCYCCWGLFPVRWVDLSRSK